MPQCTVGQWQCGRGSGSSEQFLYTHREHLYAFGWIFTWVAVRTMRVHVQKISINKSIFAIIFVLARAVDGSLCSLLIYLNVTRIKLMFLFFFFLLLLFFSVRSFCWLAGLLCLALLVCLLFPLLLLYFLFFCCGCLLLCHIFFALSLSSAPLAIMPIEMISIALDLYSLSSSLYLLAEQ